VAGSAALDPFEAFFARDTTGKSGKADCCGMKGMKWRHPTLYFY
jgi:hypothetical protein